MPRRCGRAGRSGRHRRRRHREPDRALALAPAAQRGLRGTRTRRGWRSFAFEVPRGPGRGALAAMRRWRHRAGSRSPCRTRRRWRRWSTSAATVARRLGAVNCVVNARRHADRHQHRRRGVRGLAGPRRRFDPAGRRCLVIGAGGAARAVVLALADAGAADVAVAEPDPERAAEAAALAGAAGVASWAPTWPVPWRGPTWWSTPPLWAWSGVRRGAGDAGRSRPRCSARARWRPTWSTRPARLRGWTSGGAGATALDGLGMLVHQAAAQLVLWTGLEPPVEAMWQAAESGPSPGRVSISQRSGGAAGACQVRPATLGARASAATDSSRRARVERVALGGDGVQHHPHGDRGGVRAQRVRRAAAARCSARRTRGVPPPGGPPPSIT